MDSFCLYFLHCQSNTDNIRDSIQHAHFMEMQNTDVLFMHCTFCFSNHVIDMLCIFFYAIRNRKSIDNRIDIGKMHAMMMVVMIMVMIPFLLSIDPHMHLCSCDSVFLYSLPLIAYMRNACVIEFFHKCIRMIHCIHKCTKKHITGTSHTAFNIKCFHETSPL